MAFRIVGNAGLAFLTAGSSLYGRAAIATTISVAGYLSTAHEFATAKNNTQRGLSMADGSLHMMVDIVTVPFPIANATAGFAVDVYMEALRVKADD